MIYADVRLEDLMELGNELKEAKDASWYRRLKIIHLSAQKKTVPQLVEMFDLSVATVRD